MELQRPSSDDELESLQRYAWVLARQLKYAEALALCDWLIEDPWSMVTGFRERAAVRQQMDNIAGAIGDLQTGPSMRPPTRPESTRLSRCIPCATVLLPICWNRRLTCASSRSCPATRSSTPRRFTPRRQQRFKTDTGERGVSADTALRLERYFGSEAQGCPWVTAGHIP